MDKKELIIKRLNGDIKNWDENILKLKKKLEDAKGEGKEKIESQIAELEDKIVEAKEKIENFKKKGIKGIKLPFNE